MARVPGAGPPPPGPWRKGPQTAMVMLGAWTFKNSTRPSGEKQAPASSPSMRPSGGEPGTSPTVSAMPGPPACRGSCGERATRAKGKATPSGVTTSRASVPGPSSQTYRSPEVGCTVTLSAPSSSARSQLS